MFQGELLNFGGVMLTQIWSKAKKTPENVSPGWESEILAPKNRTKPESFGFKMLFVWGGGGAVYIYII